MTESEKNIFIKVLYTCPLIRTVGNGYRSDSMDRLGDDLTELILQYMTFEDKIRLECVSKQWRRLVFNKQFGLCLQSSTMFGPNNALNKYCELESVLKKCPNITDVKITIIINSSVLSLIGRFCPHIRSFAYCPESCESDLELSFSVKITHRGVYNFATYQFCSYYLQ